MTQTPHNPDAEADFIGCCLSRVEAVDEAGDLSPEDFFLPAHRVAYDALVAVRAAGSAVDAVTVWDEIARRGQAGYFQGDAGALLALANRVPHALNAGHYARIVRRTSLLRRLMRLCAETSARAERQEDPTELVQELVRELSDLEVGDAQIRRLGDHLDEVIETIDRKARAPQEHALHTGLVGFDRIIGGFRAPQLVVVAARPGMGKTAFAGTVARNVAKRGVPVLVFSLEMAFQEIAERFLSGEAHVSGHALSTGQRTDVGPLRHAADRLRGAPLFIDDQIHSAGQIVAIARSWYLRQQQKRALVIVDYLGLMRSSGDAETRALEVGRMAWAMKDLAKRLHVPVMLVSQLNRESEKQDRKPILADLRESGDIEAHADMVVFPYRRPPLHESGPASLIVAKHRGGSIGEIDCYWHGETTTFYDHVAEVE